MQQTIKPKKHSKILKIVLIVLMVAALLSLGVYAFIYYNTRNNTKQVLSNINKQEAVIKSIPNLDTQANRDKFSKALDEIQNQINSELARLKK